MPRGIGRNLVLFWVALRAADLTGGLKIATRDGLRELEVETQSPDDS